MYWIWVFYYNMGYILTDRGVVLRIQFKIQDRPPTDFSNMWYSIINNNNFIYTKKQVFSN